MQTPLDLDSALKRVALASGAEVRGFWRAVIDDPRQVPASYRREMLDKQAIVKDLLAGISVPGCRAAWTYVVEEPERKEEGHERTD